MNAFDIIKGMAVRFLVFFLPVVLLCGCGLANDGQINSLLTPQLTTEYANVLETMPAQEAPTATIQKSLFSTPISTQLRQLTPQPPVKKKPVDPSALPQSLLVLDPIQIRLPGVGSIVVSPIAIEAQFLTIEAANALRVELRSEDGTLLVRKLIDPARLAAPGDRLVDFIEYEISTDSLDAWILLALDDAPDSSLAINSIPVVLSATGTAQLNSSDWQAKSIDIQQPVSETQVSSGELTVAGLTNLDSGQPLKFQLLGTGGRLISQGLVEIGGLPVDEFKPFSARLSYSLDQPTQARLVVYSELGQSGVVLHLSSVSIMLDP